MRSLANPDGESTGGRVPLRRNGVDTSMGMMAGVMRTVGPTDAQRTAHEDHRRIRPVADDNVPVLKRRRGDALTGGDSTPLDRYGRPMAASWSGVGLTTTVE